MCNSYESRSVSARVESYKKVRKQIIKKNFFPPHVFWDPGWEKIRIRDKHPGSATLPRTIFFFLARSADLTPGSLFPASFHLLHLVYPYTFRFPFSFDLFPFFLLHFFLSLPLNVFGLGAPPGQETTGVWDYFCIFESPRRKYVRKEIQLWSRLCL